MQNWVTYLTALLVKERATCSMSVCPIQHFIKALHLKIFICISLPVKLLKLRTNSNAN